MSHRQVPVMEEASAHSDYSASFPHDGDIPKAPLEQTSKDDPGEMAGQKYIYQPGDTATDQNGSKKPDTRSGEGNETLPYPVPEIQGDTQQFKVNPEPISISSSKDAAQSPMPSPIPGEVADHEKFHNTATEKQNGSKKPDTGEGSGTLPYPVPETQEADTQQIKEPTSSISPSKEAVQSPIPSKDDYGEVTTAGHSKLRTPENIATDTCSGEGTGILVLPHPSTKTEGDQIRELVYQDTHKAGLCVICSCTNPRYAVPIENCTAPQKMRTCFESKLGYSTILVGPNMSRQNLYDVLRDLKIPEASSEDFRFLFYFFGHGTDDEICLADGNFKRSDIISELQKLSPNIFKIIFFDSCRTDSNRNTYSLEVTMHKPIQETAIIQETASIQVLSGLGQSKKEKHYPYADCVNTLVINATIYGHKAYYMYIDNDEMKGCGLVTYFFTTLAPLMNEPLPAVLTEVRVKVDDFIKKEASSLPTSTSLSPQVLDYKDLLMGNVNLLAESKGKARVRPENARIVSKSPLSTMVQWSFHPNVYQRIKSFHVTCRNEEGKFYASFPAKKEMENVAEFSNASLKPRTTYCAKVVAKYEDGFEAESDEVPFTTKELECAKNLSLHLIKLEPLTAELRWEMSSSDDQLPQHVRHFTVRANDEIIVDRCEKTHAELPLNPGTPYLLTVETSYSDGIHSMTSISEEYHYTTPTKDEMKPKIEFFEVKRNSVVVKVSDPALFQRSEYGKMERDSLHVKCTPVGKDDSNERYKKHTIDIQREAMSNPEPVETMPNSNQVEATPTPEATPNPDPAETTPNPKPLEATPTPEATPNPESTPNPDPAGAPASYRIPLAGLIAGREYRVKCEMGCSSGDTLTSGEKFAAKNPSRMQRMWQISCCPLILLIFIAIFTPWSVFYGLYHRSEACATHYALANAVVQCGYGTSKYYQGIEIRVSSGDSLQGTLRAWNVREDDLILYSRPIGPYNIDDKLRSPYALLEGWDMYLWEGSVISGFCCVQSRNNDSQTAMLNVFLSDDDAFSFISSEGNTENYIFSETIKIPSYDQNCFRNWGVDRPLRVKRSAYHVFVLHTSTDNNMTFIYNTTIIQKYVNVSDYENPRYFSHKSQTYFPYPNRIGNPTDYVTICEAPDYVYQSISNTSSSDDYSTDIISCVIPYGWITPVFATIAGICGVLLYTCIIGVFLICKLHLCSKSKPKDPEQTEL